MSDRIALTTAPRDGQWKDDVHQASSWAILLPK